MSLRTSFLSKTTVRADGDLKIVLSKYFFPYEKILMVSLPELDNRLTHWLENLYGDSS
jgi:hypothetical protein